MGEHLPCKQGVRSSILLVSTMKVLNLNKPHFETTDQLTLSSVSKS